MPRLNFPVQRCAGTWAQHGRPRRDERRQERRLRVGHWHPDLTHLLQGSISRINQWTRETLRNQAANPALRPFQQYHFSASLIAFSASLPALLPSGALVCPPRFLGFGCWRATCAGGAAAQRAGVGVESSGWPLCCHMCHEGLAQAEKVWAFS